MNSTLAIIKPDAVRRKLQGVLILEIQAAGFTICRMVQRRLTAQEVTTLYDEHRQKDFFPRLYGEMLSSQSVILGLQAPITTLHSDVPTRFRGVVSDIRTRFTSYTANSSQNVIHGSDSIESALREIDLFFPTE